MATYTMYLSPNQYTQQKSIFDQGKLTLQNGYTFLTPGWPTFVKLARSCVQYIISFNPARLQLYDCTEGSKVTLTHSGVIIMYYFQMAGEGEGEGEDNSHMLTTALLRSVGAVGKIVYMAALRMPIGPRTKPIVFISFYGSPCRYQVNQFWTFVYFYQNNYQGLFRKCQMRNVNEHQKLKIHEKLQKLSNEKTVFYPIFNHLYLKT